MTFEALHVPPERIRRRIARSFCALVGCSLLLFPGSALGQAPDLAANWLTGPSIAAPGDIVSLRLNITSIGGTPPVGVIYEIRLSTDPVISSSDTLVVTAFSLVLGTLNLDNTLIPTTLSPGTYFWGLIVHPVSGEIITSNNTVIGNQVAYSEPVLAWADLGNGLAGATGIPILSGTDSLSVDNTVALALRKALPVAFSTLVVGVSKLGLPFKCGVMVPTPDLLLAMTTNLFGDADLSAMWPPGVPPGFTFYWHWWIQDAAGPCGFASSNAISATTP